MANGLPAGHTTQSLLFYVGYLTSALLQVSYYVYIEWLLEGKRRRGVGFFHNDEAKVPLHPLSLLSPLPLPLLTSDSSIRPLTPVPTFTVSLASDVIK